MTLQHKTSNTFIVNDLTDSDIGDIHQNTSDYHATFASTKISRAITLTTLKIKTSDEVNLIFEDSSNKPLRFLYCHKGDLFINLVNRKRKLSSFQNAILYDNESNIELALKSDSSYKFSIISLNKDLSTYSPEESGLLAKLFNTITKGNTNKIRCYISSRNLAIGMALKGLGDLDGEKFGDKLVLAGKIRVILGLEYQQLQKDLNPENTSNSALTRKEMRRVSSLIEKIKKNPGNNYTVSTLSTEAGLSENKLQEGFKELFNRTVTDCIRNIRLEKAEELLKTTDLNVSEVVYSVGFISRSYFSKIFKAKYNCSPSFYKKQQQQTEVVA
ncbi:helix-turn-helix domain-containing protein [Winogradskyella sp. A3E31]|uniref:helix-turn-helix domain-containing protein n=1 Tax=Winogradskyella sp. A3E31 TaxID=3349637 RepID=UPI00398AFD8A